MGRCDALWDQFLFTLVGLCYPLMFVLGKCFTFTNKKRLSCFGRTDVSPQLWLKCSVADKPSGIAASVGGPAASRKPIIFPTLPTKLKTLLSVPVSHYLLKQTHIYLDKCFFNLMYVFMYVIIYLFCCTFIYLLLYLHSSIG